MAYTSLLGDVWTVIGDIFAGLFAIVPQCMYLIYASIASLLDMFQYVFRKLAGLDAYYVDGVERTGDIVTDMIEGIIGVNERYSALTTVFWSLIIFGVIVLILMTIVSIIKAHYSYDSKKSSPAYVLKLTAKALGTMAMVPAITLLGLYLGSALFKALDSITSTAATTQLDDVYESAAITKFKPGTRTQNGNGERYASYDMFASGEYTNTSTFSGILFKACSVQANRVRNGSYSVNSVDTTDENGNPIDPSEWEVREGSWDNNDIFYTTKTVDTTEIVAQQIDYAFANNLTLKNPHTFTLRGEAFAAIGSTLTYGPSAIFAGGLINVKSFSKYNVGLVWYFYNLWAFNFILAFAGGLSCLTLMTNILFGLVMRIILSAIMFMVYPPLVGLMPFDEGHAIKSWRSQFMGYIVSAYTSIVALNIIFLLMPVLQAFSMFNNTLLDSIVTMLFILAALSMAKRFVDMTAQFVGAQNIDQVGGQVKKEGAKPAMKGIEATVGAASVAALAFKIPGKVAQSAIENNLSPEERDKLNVAKRVKESKFGKKVKSAKDKVAGGVNKILEKPFAKVIASRFGIPVDPHTAQEYEEVVEIGDDGKPVIDAATGKPKTKQVLRSTGEKKKTPLGFIKNELVDLSKVAFKGIGEISGAKKFVDALDKNTRAVDIFKSRINELAEDIRTLGTAGQAAPMKKPIFKTKKYKEDEAIRKQADRATTQVSLDPYASSDALDAIMEMIKDAKDLKNKR